MSAPETTANGWQWPADVLEFANRHQIQVYLEPLLDATNRVFPTASLLRIYLGEDPEIPGDQPIVFDVRMCSLDLSAARAAQKEWNRQLLGLCPGPLATHFGLILDHVP
jgi:hypothetical protein